MRIIKYAHACVRIESDDAVLVVDPGAWTQPAALDGADAVLITHEHFDHLNVAALAEMLARRPAVTVYTNAEVAGQLSALAGVVTVIADREEFRAAGIAVRAYSGPHAQIHPEIPRVANTGFLIADRIFHPGDSFAVPDFIRPTESGESTVEILFVPVSAPWLRLADSVEFVRAVAPRRALALHDCLLSAEGGQVTDSLLGRLLACDYARLGPGEPIELR